MLLGKSNSFGTLKILIIAIGLFSVTGCKKPESNFRLNKYEYAAGEMLLLENLSINAKETTWEIISPENEIIETSNQKNPSLILGIMIPDGFYTLKLTSFAKNEKRSSVDEKPFAIKTVRTYLTINQSGNGDHTNYTVYIDNQLIGESNFDGSFQAQIPLGYRIVRLVDGNEEKTESIVFKENTWEYLNF